jgi:pyrroloquinoline-quinone synthase
MSVPVRTPRIMDQAEAILHRVDFSRNPYLRSLTDGTMSLNGFRRSQQQFYFAVAYFPQPMAVLLSRLSDPQSRVAILHNLVEEHGDFRAEEFHPQTFRRFLETIDCRADEMSKLTECSAVRAFNLGLHGACAFADVEVGVCCLGAIELAFAGISATIGRAVIERGWIAAEQLVHYRLHAEIDKRHAEEFFAAVQPALNDPFRRKSIEQGLELGAYLFDQLYRGLYMTASELTEQSSPS